MKKVCVVIINFKADFLTRDCLDSLLKVNKINFNLEVVVVDTYPKKRTSVNPSKYKGIGLKIILTDNKGFTGGNNLGIDYALENKADYILILNNDTVVEENLIANLLEGFKQKEKIGAISPKIYFEKGYEFHKDRYKESEKGKVIWYAGGIIDWENVYTKHKGVDEVDNGQFDRIEEVDFATGCALFTSAQVISEMKGFDNRYFLYFEDSDLSQRLKKAGYKILFYPKAILWHKNGGSTGGSGSSLQDYFTTRNRMIFGLKFAPLRSKIALIRESLRLLSSGRRWQKKGIRDFYLRRFGKGTFPLKV